VASDAKSTLTVSEDTVDGVVVLAVVGRLDATTYLLLRDSIIKAALDEPAAVIIDINGLEILADSAMAVFTSARWHVGTWPEVPIVLVSDRESIRRAIVRNGVARYIPVHATISAALSEPARTPERRRARTDLPSGAAGLPRCRDLVTQWLGAWSQDALVPVAKIIATTFVENVLSHTTSASALRLETDGTTVTVAVDDTSRAPPSMPEPGPGYPGPMGLRLVSALSRRWGYSPTPGGKTVWAILGPENRL
jgi:anti-anti-sigma factor